MDVGYDKLKDENPKKNASLVKKLFFGWMISLIRKGRKKNLEISDLYTALDEDNSKLLGDRLDKQWKLENLRSQQYKRKPSLFKAIINTFFYEYMSYGILWFILNVVFRCVQPLILGRLVSLFVEDYNENNENKMYIYSGLLIATSTCAVFITHHIQLGLASIGMRIRIACSSLVYRKLTKLNHKSLGETAVGQIVNLLSNDVHRFDLVTLPLHTLWTIPIQVGVLTYFIWQQVGISSLAGVVSMILISLPLQGYLAKLMGSLRSNISQKTDIRVKLMNEVISGIQVIKMYSWEKPFEKMVQLARKKEINMITAASYLRGIFSSCLVFLERMALAVTTICYVSLGNTITADKVFSLAQAYNILQLSLAVMYPMAIAHGAEALISIKRLGRFLTLEEKAHSTIEPMLKPGIIFTNVSASWTDEGNTLTGVTLQIPPGYLCAVIGPVGAGKTSLLHLLLGELPITSGRIQLGGEISYSSQGSWLFQSTVRNNIVFGKTYDQQWYEKVVKVCALERDFELLAQGDLTIVGERGVSLSGGQRARVNLARAVYRQADVYLLDDPLSAVDTHVGKHLFEQCILKHLKGKTRILVTHQLQYLKKANLIVVLNEGRIEAVGTFKELSKSKVDFTKFLVEVDETSEKHEEFPEGESVTFVSSPRKTSLASLTLSGMTESREYLDEPTQSEENPTKNKDKEPKTTPLKDYILAADRVWVMLLLAFLLIFSQVICAGVDLWVTFWTTQEQLRHENSSILLNGSSITPKDQFEYKVRVYQRFEKPSTGKYMYKYSYQQTAPPISTTTFIPTTDGIFDSFDVNGEEHNLVKTNIAMYFYGFLILLAIIFTLARSLLFFKLCMMSSVNMHARMFSTLLKAPMKFFDTNPSGRILNRFSKDMGSIDEILPKVLMDSIQIVLTLCGILVNVLFSNPYSIIAILILGAVFMKLRGWYIFTARVLKRLEGSTKSPMFSHVNSSINGIATIRASKAEGILIDEFDDHQNVHTSAWYLTISSTSAFGLWLDMICLAFLAAVTFSFVYLQKFTAVNGSLVGLAISQAMILTGMLQYGMRQTAEAINQLTGVERVLQYTKIETEGPFDSEEDLTPPEPWPRKGRVEYKNVYLKYSECDPPVLRNVNFIISPGEKIGIVGRTGAGKSSLITVLFRLANFLGNIYIDDVDTRTVGLGYLRKKISIIPQEPVLFSSTLRYNLDPFDEFNDEEIWKALEQVELRDCVSSLDFIVSEAGSNFSVGQRQLVCLARAALRNNKILILDEATANIDHRTDALIQATIRERFKDCTVITIAHRLNTIMDCDKVMVMNYGELVESDHPHKLLQIIDGYFHKMVLETGPFMSMQLKDIAMNAYYDNYTECFYIK